VVRRLFRLWGLYARLDWAYITQDAFTAIVTVVCELTWGMASLVGTALLAIQFGGVGTLSTADVLVMLSFHLFSSGVEVMLFGGNNVSLISRRVGRAQVDHMLIQPLPLWAQLITEGFMPVSGCQQAVCGLIALCLFVPRAQIAVTAGWVLLLALLAACRIAIRMAVSYMAGSAAFWNPVGCEELSDIVLSLCSTVSDYPLSGMPRMVVGTLLTVLPLGVLTYLPGLVLLGRMDALWAAWPVLLAVMLVSAAQYLFRKGVRHYVKAGCARYKSMGHRC